MIKLDYKWKQAKLVTMDYVEKTLSNLHSICTS